MTTSSETDHEKPKLSKRQRRQQGPNPSNTWPQQPKIKSEAARNKAYLANAGFSPGNNNNNKSEQNARGKKRKNQHPALDPDLDVINSPEFKFGRLLASPDARTRHATILKLQAYLQARCAPFVSDTATDNLEGDGKKRRRKNGDSARKGNDDDDNVEKKVDNGGHFRGLSELDLLKLWKGLWHTLYLCDGVAVQTEVSKVLAKLMWSVAGSEEQDEYAGRLYLEIDEDRSAEGSADGGEEEAEEGDSTEGDEVAEKKVTREDDDANETGPNLDSKDDSSASSDNDSLDESNTKHCRGAHLSQLFIRTYFKTLNREWYKMDKYRIDKFYTLTRLILRETYRYMAARHWNLGIIRLFNDALFEEVLQPTVIGGVSGGYGNGVRFHILDICLEELSLVNAEESTGLKLTEATLLDCLEPFFEVLVKVQDKILHDRVMDKVVNRFLVEYSIVSDNYDVSSDDEQQDDEDDGETVSKKKRVMSEVHVGSVAQFIFELASDSKTLDRYRKALYDMHKTYAKRIKEVGRDVSLNEDEDDEEYDICEDGEEVENGIDLSEEEHMIEVLKENVKEKDETPLNSARKEKKQKKKKSKGKKDNKTHDQKTNSSTKEVENEESGKILEDDETNDKETMSAVVKNKGKEDGKKVENEKTGETITNSSKKDSKIKDANEDTPSSKKRRKKKKKSPEKEAEEELSITITVDEQKAAVKAATKTKEAEAKEKETTCKKKDEGTENNADLVTPKKVKFRKMNTSKSYKASIKDLKKIDHNAERTPEKGILMKRIRDESATNDDMPQSSGKKSRKKRKKSKK